MSHPHLCHDCGAPLIDSEGSCSRCLLANASKTPDQAKLGNNWLDELPIPIEALLIADRYTVVETIARGGMGVVYKARQENLNRIVAVKMLLGGAHAGEDFKRRFLQEAKAAAGLSHANIVAIHDWGEDSGQPFFSMEYIHGHTLAEMAREKPMAPRAAAEMVRTLALAMDYAHQHGILHRDLKPSNVLVDQTGTPRITDFGLARDLNAETLLTVSGDLLGTPGYLPPEQVSTKRTQIGPPSDIYGLGAILYYLLTSRPPHSGDSMPRVLRAVMEEDPVSPKRLVPNLPADLVTLCLKCLEKEPERRYQTAALLAEELGRFLEHQPIHAAAPSVAYRFSKFCKRHRASLLRTASAVILACVVVSGLFLVAGKRPIFLQPRDATPDARSINVPPHIGHVRAVSGVYIRDYSSIGSTKRMLGVRSQLFVQLKPSEGGWRAFQLPQLNPLAVHPNTVAYVTDSDSAAVFELAMTRDGLACGTLGQGDHRQVSAPNIPKSSMTKLIAVSHTVGGLIVCALPDLGMLFALDPKSGRLAWSSAAGSQIEPPSNRSSLDHRIGHVSADGGLVFAGMWSGRIWVVDASTGQLKWTWAEPKMGNAIYAIGSHNRVYAFSASENAYAFEAISGTPLWERRVGRCDDEGAVALHGDQLILCPSAGPMLSLNSSDGKALWASALLSSGERSVSVLSNLVVVAAGAFVQRFDPATGNPGAFIELPTLKKSITLYGKEQPVEISHPPALSTPDEAHVFTLDGSIWCLHLPTTLTNVVAAQPERPNKGLEGRREQVNPSEREMPAYPPELIAWQKRLAGEGRSHLWLILESRIKKEWTKAASYAYGLGGDPHVIIGRVATPNGVDPRDVYAQMEILEGGFFAGATKDLNRPIGFRLPGHLAKELPLEGKTGGLVFVSDIAMVKTSTEQMATLSGRVVKENGEPARDVVFKMGMPIGTINTPSNGIEPRDHWPESLSVPLRTDGGFEVEGLSPAAHWLTIQAEGCLTIRRDVSLEPGRKLDLGNLSLPRQSRIKVSWVVAPKREFSGLASKRGNLKGGENWSAVPHEWGSDLTLKQTLHELSFDHSYGPCEIADLGEMTLATAMTEAANLTLEQGAVDVREGHVYILHQSHGGFGAPYWALLRVDIVESAP